MTNSQIETAKRINLAKNEMEKYRDFSLGVILAGSVAYSPNCAVTENSDLDLIVIVENLKDSLELAIQNKKERKALNNRFFEGYCTKEQKEDVAVSTHILSRDAFEIISKCFVADIRVYRPESKSGIYNLKGFEGNLYPYYIQNIELKDLKGVRTIVPVSFINKDRYYLGIHRDKLLSNPSILHENKGYISAGIDKVWSIVVENLYNEANRLYSQLNLENMNVLNALAKKDKMCEDAVKSIEDKTQFYLKRLNH